jgi:hypothetical protein
LQQVSLVLGHSSSLRRSKEAYRSSFRLSKEA